MAGSDITHKFEKEHHKIGGIIIQNRKMLMCRKYDEPHFILPGGKPIEGETPEQTMTREFREELGRGVELIAMKYYKSWEVPHFEKKGVKVRMDCYFAEIEGTPVASSEINELQWVDSRYKDKGIKVAEISEKYLLPELKARGLID